MGTLAFFRQARVDRGMRTGVDWNETPLLHDFQEGGDEHDPAIIWYVDVEFVGDALPVDAEKARQWLVRRGTTVAAALRSLADDLSLGIDVGSWPVKRAVVGLPRGVTGAISCSAVRRIDCRHIAERLHELADHWRQIIRRLPPMREAA
jgi:hypothetical protein